MLAWVQLPQRVWKICCCSLGGDSHYLVRGKVSKLANPAERRSPGGNSLNSAEWDGQRAQTPASLARMSVLQNWFAGKIMFA